MKFINLTMHNGTRFGTTCAGRIYYHNAETGECHELVHKRNRLGQLDAVYRYVRDPALVQEINEGMDNYEG